jgi:tetratricopeptide (TPR) repeat protein
MFIANSKKVAYFTYNGGRVFTFATPPTDGGKSSVVTDGNGNVPKTAADYALLGQAHLSRGELSAALANLDEAIRMAPEQAAYYVARANAHEANRQPEAAIGDLDKSLSLDPGNVDALLMRARLRIAHEDRAGAMSDVAAAGAKVPAGSTRALPVAILYVELDQPAAALPLLDDWIRLHRDDAMLGTALNERCWARGLSNQLLDEALKDCRRALKRDGNRASYLDSLGLVELRLGHYAEAIKAYEQALTQMPHSAWSRYGLGLAKLRAGQADAGKADLAAAHALDPTIETLAGKFGLTAAGP